VNTPPLQLQTKIISLLQ